MAQLNMQFRSQLTYPGLSLANIWGYVDGLGNEYALVGTSTGVSIVNVNNPTNPVQVFTVAGTTSQWREIKTWGQYAYVTTEGGTNGLQIINLSNLPASVSSSYWTGSGAIAGLLQRIHSLHIDNGYAYLNGSNLFNGAALIVSLANPASPVYVSNTTLSFTGNTRYVHDCYVRNDTMFGANIYAGMFTIINVSNKSVPVLINTQTTPNNFTHNCWLSDDGRKLFTTDETSNSFLAAYDISNPGNIIYLDKVQSNPGSLSIVHNTYVKNDYAVSSWYKDGVIITDASRPDNLIITANYDTYSQGAGNGFNGCWGVYPYLPSGNIIASDINNGLFVLTPTYVRACYLEGNITNSCSGVALSTVNVQISGSNSDISLVNGNYKTGTPTAGSYTVTFTKAGFFTKTINNVSLSNGNLTTLNIALVPLTAITAANPVVTNLTCNGQGNGQITINPTGGTLPLQYLWSTTATTQNTANLQAGTFTVTITDAAGCTFSSFSTVTQPAALNPSPTSNSPLCFGSTLLLNAAGGFNSYQWSGPAGYQSSNQNNSISNANGANSGTYTLTVTDINGCSNNLPVNVQVSDIIISAAIKPVACFNTATGSINISVSGGIGLYTYLWNNGATTEDLNNKTGQTFTITVTDGSGCTKTASFSIPKPTASLIISSSRTNVRCFGSSTGTITVNPAGGVPPYSFLWNTVPVKTTASISGLSTGTYTATVTDAYSCIKTITITITQPTQIILTSTQTNVTTYGGSDGTANAFVSGGVAPYNYFWTTNPNSTNSSVTNLLAGTYKCKVTDNKGCVKSKIITITQPDPVRYTAPLINENKPIVYPNPAREFVTIDELNADQTTSCALYDVAGRNVFSLSSAGRNKITIPVSALYSGVYLLEIKSDINIYNFRIVIP